MLQNPVATTSDELKQAITDFGPVLGLGLEGGTLMGSLFRIRTALQRGSRGEDSHLADLSVAALDALNARERANGSQWGLDNPDGFKKLTEEAAEKAMDLYRYLSEEARG